MTKVSTGTVLGTFETVVERSMVWPVDWSVGLDVPEYQDPDVAQAEGSRQIPVPPGGLVFFAFLDGDGWMERAGVAYDRSLAARRRVRMLAPLHVGDRVSGAPTVTDVTNKVSKDGTPSRWVTISTTYHCDGDACVEEHVTYVTREA